MKLCGIYGWYCTASDKWYVGQSGDIHARRRTHLYDLRNGIQGNLHFLHAWHKYGEERFEFHILEELQEELLDPAECWWIEYFKSTDRRLGYNLASGGLVNRNPSEETRQKMSESQRGKCYSSETKRRMSESAKRRAPISDTTRRKISEAGLRCNRSDETLLKMSEAQKRRPPFPKETRRKMSEASLRQAPPSAETRKKISEAGKRRAPASEETRRKMSRSQTRRHVAARGTVNQLAQLPARSSTNPEAADHRSIKEPA